MPVPVPPSLLRPSLALCTPCRLQALSPPAAAHCHVGNIAPPNTYFPPYCPLRTPLLLPVVQLIAFGLSLFIKSSNNARLSLLKTGVPGLVAMLLELAPTLGDYYPQEKSLKVRRRVDYCSILWI